MVLTWRLQKFEIYIVKGGCTLSFGSSSTLWQAERVSRCYNTTFLEVTVNGAQSERNKED